MRLCWYGDDFTGATDTLAVVAQAGLRTLLFTRVPTPDELAAAGPLDALGIAGAARAMAPEAMRAELTGVGQFFKSLDAAVVHYKVCSTFDSSAQVGSIGCAVQTLHPTVDNRWVPMVGGQPSLGRYCAFSNLFAAAGTGGTVHRLDRHPTMSRHPVTPMAEADLRVHLALQGLEGMTALHYPQYQVPPEELDATLQALQGKDPQSTLATTLLDLTSPRQLAVVGRLIWQQAQRQRLLAVGSSAVAQALIAHWAADASLNTTTASQSAQSVAPPFAQTTTQSASSSRTDRLSPGPVFALAGSLSPLTARQVQATTSYQRLAVDAMRLARDSGYAQATLASIVAGLRQGRHVLAHTAPTNGQPPDVSAAARVATASTQLVVNVVQAQAEHGTPLHRLGIAGGDTSSHAVQALDLWGLSYIGALCPGVAMTRGHSQDPTRDGMQLMLKGGQMGGDDLFERLLAYE